MKLITKLHDYYDSIAGSTASDKLYTFVREQKEVILPRNCNIKLLREEHEDIKNRYLFESGIIGFCGAMYPYLKVTETDLKLLSSTTDYFYSMDELLKEYPNIVKLKQSYKYHLNVDKLENWFKTGRVSWWGGYNDNLSDPYLKEFFFKNRVIYFVVQGKSKQSDVVVESYPVLKDFKFFRKFDSYTTFQMIEHFLTNELVRPDKVDIIIPDKLKAQSKGFDKWSFRKMPE
jgi:hypothetical protein